MFLTFLEISFLFAGDNLNLHPDLSPFSEKRDASKETNQHINIRCGLSEIYNNLEKGTLINKFTIKQNEYLLSFTFSPDICEIHKGTYTIDRALVFYDEHTREYLSLNFYDLVDFILYGTISSTTKLQKLLNAFPSSYEFEKSEHGT